jgi:hypothetical protein
MTRRRSLIGKCGSAREQVWIRAAFVVVVPDRDVKIGIALKISLFRSVTTGWIA